MAATATATSFRDLHEKPSPETVVQDLEHLQNGSIASSHVGTMADREDMRTLGKKQVLRRNFKFVSMLGFASTVMASWEVLLPFFAFSLIDGGTALLFWGMIAVAIVMMFIYASIAEIASMAPTAGGQYHYVSELAPPKAQRLLSFVVGWLTALGWQAYLAGTCFIVALMVQGLIALNVSDYTWHNWHGTLLAIAFVLFSVAFNSILAAHLPLLGRLALILHFLGPFVIGITLWATAPPRDPRIALLEFVNNGGWSSTGLSAMVGLVTPLSTLNVYDCSVHMSEEIRDASLTLPRVLMASAGLNAALVLFLVVTLIFTMGDLEVILHTSTGQPFIQVFYNATQSYIATNILTAIVIILLSIACISEVATASRQIWSFARDGGLPASAWLSQVSPSMKVPVRAVYVSVILSSLLACINLGSSTALNAINSLGAVSILTSYFVTIGCTIWRRIKGPPLPRRRWSLGRLGMSINVVALVGLTPLWFFAMWPLARPVTPQNMNWSSTMFGATVVLVSLYYVSRARYRYNGPVVLVKRDY